MKDWKLVFIDTEVTGLEEEDRICQIAYKIGKKIFNELFKPPLPIKVGAMAVHHITNKMVENKQAFVGSKMQKDLKKLFSDETSLFVAHNASFDVDMLQKEDIEVKNAIDTLKLARHLDEEAEIESYSLQYLRYLLDLDIEATAHDAEGDVLVLEALFARIKEQMIEKYGEENLIEKMLEISSKPTLFKRFSFGKHKGKLIVDVALEDRSYLEWLNREKISEDTPDEDWIHTLKHYLS